MVLDAGAVGDLLEGRSASRRNIVEEGVADDERVGTPALKLLGRMDAGLLLFMVRRHGLEHVRVHVGDEEIPGGRRCRSRSP
jgi:hypothetical protein